MSRYDRHSHAQRERDKRSDLRAANKVYRLGDNVALGSRLHGRMAGKPMIIMGNAHSLNYQDMDLMRKFPILGCNRILRLFEPDFYTVVDRAPYIQEVERIKAYKGIRILSETLFDPAVSCRRTPVQPLPDYEWYKYRAVATSTPFPKGNPVNAITYYSNDKRVRRGKLPSVQTNLDDHMPSGANIAYCMLQIALAMGANPIGIAGVDMKWESVEKSHFFGKGKAVGAFEFNSARVMQFFEAAAHYGRTNGVKIYNLSPKGILTPTFARISEVEFHSRFGGDSVGNVLRSGELIKFEPDRHATISGTGQHGRSESDIKKVLRKLAPDSRPRGIREGSPKDSSQHHRACLLDRAARERQKARARKPKRN